MKITTKGCYGLHAMLDLASAYGGGGPLLMRAIAERHAISRKYLHALLTSLRAAGLVRSVRGAAGGYVLARSPREIRVGQVLRALEGSLSVADCVAENAVCARAGGCRGRALWAEMSRIVDRMLDAMTLADLAGPREERIADTNGHEDGSRYPI
jgi:Rrf2 family protein